MIVKPTVSELLEEVHSVTLPTGLDDSSYAIRSTYIKEDIEIRQEADARDKVRIATIFAGFMLLINEGLALASINNESAWYMGIYNTSSWFTES